MAGYVVAAAAAIAAIVGAAATYESGRKQASIAEDNQKIANADAQAVIDQSQQAADLRRAQIKRLIASGRALEGGSGFAYSGTPELVATTVANEGEKDAMAILAQGLTNASRLRAGGRIQMEQGKAAEEGSQYAAAGTLLQSYANWNNPRIRTSSGGMS